MPKKIILHIDMNSYFASVEQQANPFLRGKSVGVCSYLSPRGVIIASSMEAKKHGIKTGCRVESAKQLDKDIVLLENEPAKYRTITEKIFAILKKYTDTLEPYSIDEAFLDLSGWVDDFAQAKVMAEKIQKDIKRDVGTWLNSSVGISWTKFLAKFAGDIAPKKSILMIDDEQKLDSILRNRSLLDAWGINIATETRLNLLGIKNLGDLKKYSPDRIRMAMGRNGYYLWANVNGQEINKVRQGEAQSKSIGHSYCLPKKTTDKKYLSKVLYKLCEKTGRRLRAREQEAGSLNIHLAYSCGGGVNKSWRSSEKLFCTEDIFHEFDFFLASTSLLFPIRMISVAVSRLAKVSGQMSFFQDKARQKDLSRALDKINNKYGEYTLLRGQMFDTEDIARDRVGFRKTLEV